MRRGLVAMWLVAWLVFSGEWRRMVEEEERDALRRGE